MWSEYSEAVDPNDANVEEMGDDCGTRTDKRRYRREICSRPKDRKDDLQFDTKDYQWFSGANRETCVKECTLAEQSNKKQLQNEKSHLQKHRGIKPLKCDICMMTFTQRDSLKRHIRSKHRDDTNGKDYKCSDCSYATNDKNHFHRHLDTHTGIKPLHCDICMMKFTRKDNLKIHIRKKHTDDANGKDYKCSDCSYVTNDKSYFQRHLDTHTGIKPFQCDICMMKFTRKSDLTRHIKNKHAADGSAKDYQCSECSFSTNYKYSLQVHLKTHNGIKGFTCEICMMEFTQKSDLKRHIKNKHAADGSAKDYQCSECSYETNFKSDLKKHLNKHRGIKPFKCDICMMEFSRKDYLAKHIKNKHTGDGNVKD